METTFSDVWDAVCHRVEEGYGCGDTYLTKQTICAL